MSVLTTLWQLLSCYSCHSFLFSSMLSFGILAIFLTFHCLLVFSVLIVIEGPSSLIELSHSTSTLQQQQQEEGREKEKQREHNLQSSVSSSPSSTSSSPSSSPSS